MVILLAQPMRRAGARTLVPPEMDQLGSASYYITEQLSLFRLRLPSEFNAAFMLLPRGSAQHPPHFLAANLDGRQP